MKTSTILFAILFASCFTHMNAQDTWVQVADFGGAAQVNRVGFSIGNKGYVGTGDYSKDFWEYDQATNVWTQKADVGGQGRDNAVGFSIGDKGYIGTGAIPDTFYVFILVKDFWEYDPSTNTWTQKADFGGVERAAAVGFSINGKGYIGTGVGTSSGKRKDFWEYNPATDSWTKKADFPGAGRVNAVGFSIGNKGYLGTGRLADMSITKDFWEYDPSINTWTQKADLGNEVSEAVGFSIGSKGYIGVGNKQNTQRTKDFWEYNPASNSWSKKQDFPGTGRENAVGFSIGNLGYLGMGVEYFFNEKDLWQYTPEGLTCLSPTNFSVTNTTSSSVTLNWDEVAGAEGYKVRYKVAGTSVWTKKTTINNSKIISGLLPNTAYKWEVKTYCHIDSPSVSSGWSIPLDFSTTLRLAEQSSQQASFQLYPNPVEDRATIQYTLAQSSHISISVFDARGKEIKTVGNDAAEEGTHTLQLNIKDFPSGIYFVKMISDFKAETQKLMVQ